MLDSRDLKLIEEFRYVNSKPLYVFDTAAFLSALQLYMYMGEIVTTPSVIEEVKDSESVSRLGTALAIGRINVRTPSPRHIARAKDTANRMGLLEKLSKADIEVLALALELKDEGFRPIVFTDDYDIQTILKFIGIEFRSIKNLGIK